MILFSAKMNQTRNKDHGFVDYIHNLMSILMMWSSETETPANQITHLLRMKNIWHVFISNVKGKLFIKSFGKYLSFLIHGLT